MSKIDFDPRCTPARPDLADIDLQGTIHATRYVTGERGRIGVACTGLYPQPDATQEMQTELLFGEAFNVLETTENWVWGQAMRDGYVGYLARTALSDMLEPDHWVSALRTPIFQWPDLKAPISGFLHRNSWVNVAETSDVYCDVGPGWVHKAHISALDVWAKDFINIALSYLHAPYVWGGRSSSGLDCSALVQNALFACGIKCLRDTDMQEETVGEKIAFDGDLSTLQRGDLLFWKGHVGIMAETDILLHANAYHMATALEPVDTAIARIQSTIGPVRTVRRLP
ncbi:MAG: C40 family peptidase [Robiginitomaculum sp.]|nr:C40 family peptidase [Robiginitomaculum sp.]